MTFQTPAHFLARGRIEDVRHPMFELWWCNRTGTQVQDLNRVDTYMYNRSDPVILDPEEQPLIDKLVAQKTYCVITANKEPDGYFTFSLYSSAYKDLQNGRFSLDQMIDLGVMGQLIHYHQTGKIGIPWENNMVKPDFTVKEDKPLTPEQIEILEEAKKCTNFMAMQNKIRQVLPGTKIKSIQAGKKVCTQTLNNHNKSCQDSQVVVDSES